MGIVPSQSARRSLVVVAGPGRSGTSLVTGLIARLGFHVPKPEMRPNPTNPRGFGEPLWALAFHKRLMKSSGVNLGDTRPEAIELVNRATAIAAVRDELVTWLREQFDSADRVIVKDPRLVWFVDLYRMAAEELGVDFAVVTMVRHPAETIRSADTAYGGLDVSTRAAGWINGALTIERTTRAMPRALVRHEDLLTDWRRALDAAEQALPFPLTSAATDAELAAADDLIDSSLHRSRSAWSGLGVPELLQRPAMRTFEALTALATARDASGSTGALTELDTLTASYEADYQVFTAIVRSTISAARASERRLVTEELKKAAVPIRPNRARSLAARAVRRLKRLGPSGR